MPLFLQEYFIMNNQTVNLFSIKQRGVTLIELVLVMAIAGILFVVATAVLSAGFRSYFSAKEHETHHLSSEIALHRMAREIRNAQQWVNLDVNNLIFYDNNGLSIRYYLQKNQLMRKAANHTARPLLDNVNSLIFNYYDAELQTTNDLNKATYVQFTFVISKEKNTMSYQHMIFARNAP